MSRQNSHWVQAGLAFVLTFLVGAALLPLVRAEPRAVHKYFNQLDDWIRYGFTFFVCVLFTQLVFKLLSPKVGQLRHWKTHPPVWLGVLVAVVMVAFADLGVGFSPKGYGVKPWEWAVYGGGSLLVVALWSEIVGRFQKQKKEAAQATDFTTIRDIATASWEDIEAWLQTDAPAKHGFLGNQSVAHRVSSLIAEHTRSVGIVGPFGAGKTSIVKRVEAGLRSHQDDERRYFICSHSCWGFETSSSAIHTMLELAVSEIRAEIDTFQFDSLPESYRHTFTASGNWAYAVSNILLCHPDPIEQFRRLSELLGTLKRRLVFIVEDLDRSETRNFEIQEILGFLERLKGFSNFRFILTGGLTSSRQIDYAKLCDHIEYLRTIEKRDSTSLIKRVTQQCLDNKSFPHVRLSHPRRNYDFDELTQPLLLTRKEMSIPDAIAEILSTPRSLRLALWHSWRAWNDLFGEVDLGNLIGTNVLRYGAPECFNFMMRHWSILNRSPKISPEADDKDSRTRRRINEDWNRTTKNVDWSPIAALEVMEYLLPATIYWLVDEGRYGITGSTPQGIHVEKYWRRIVSGAIDDDEIRDQEVLRDIEAWWNNPCVNVQVVEKMTASPDYGVVWGNVAGELFWDRNDKILLLCKQVICRILEEHGASACGESCGFKPISQYVHDHLSSGPENLQWLQDRISDAAVASLEMVNALWCFFDSSMNNSYLESTYCKSIRQHVLEVVKSNVTDGQSLICKLSPNTSNTLWKLVKSRVSTTGRGTSEIRSWSWLAPHIIEALRSGNSVVALNVCALLSGDYFTASQGAVDEEVLDAFFGADVAEVIDLTESMINRIPEKHRLSVRNVIGATRQHLTGKVDG